MLSREPTPRSPPSSATTAGDSVISNPAARTLPYAPTVLAPMPKQSIAAPIQPAPGVEISNQCSTAPSPPPLVAPTAPKTTRQATGIARHALYLTPVLPLTPQKRKLPHLSPPAAHLNQPPARFLRLTRMPWTLSRTKQVSPHPLPHPPPPALSPPWSSLPQGPILAPRLWVSRDPPPGPVAPNPMGSPAPPLPPEISRPHAGKCLTIHLLHLGAGPPRATYPLFSTTASGAGMCFFPCFIPLLQLSAPLM